MHINLCIKLLLNAFIIFYLQVFLKVAEEADAEEEGIITNKFLLFKFENDFDVDCKTASIFLSRDTHARCAN